MAEDPQQNEVFISIKVPTEFEHHLGRSNNSFLCDSTMTIARIVSRADHRMITRPPSDPERR